MSFLAYTDTLFWLITFVIFLAIELSTQNLVTIWFAAGAFIDIFVSLPKSGAKNNKGIFEQSLVSPLWQIVLFLLLTISLFLIFYPRLKRWTENKKIATNVDSMIGQKGMVTVAISSEKMGQVSIKGQIWSALSIDNQPIEKDLRVEVIAVQGVKVLVKQITEEKQ